MDYSKLNKLYSDLEKATNAYQVASISAEIEKETRRIQAEEEKLYSINNIPFSRIEAIPEKNSTIEKNSNQQKKIFISHCVADKIIGEKLVEALLALGISRESIFFSSNFHLGVSIGKEFPIAIKNALQESALVIFLITKNFYGSPFCLNEMGAAWYANKEIRPILLDGLSFRDMQGFINSDYIAIQPTFEDLRKFVISIKPLIPNFDESKSIEEVFKGFIEEAKYRIENNKAQKDLSYILELIDKYSESAKKANDEYMKKVWDRVKEQELLNPNSFSKKTLDILNNMSAEEFKLFEKCCSISVYDGIDIDSGICSRFGLSWTDKCKLKEYGLLHLESSVVTMQTKAHGSHPIFCSNNYSIIIQNLTDKVFDFRISFQPLTSSAKELKKVAVFPTNENYLFEYMRRIKSEYPQFSISLYNTNNVIKDGDNKYFESIYNIL